MREYSPDAKVALLWYLAKTESLRSGDTQVEIWILRKQRRTLRCVAVYLPIGVDVRALEDGDIRRTQLVKDGPHAEALAHEWLRKAGEPRLAERK